MSRSSMTNRGSNLIAAMNPMSHVDPNQAGEVQSLLETESLKTTATVSGGVKPVTSKIILALFSVAAVGALVALIVILATKKSDSTAVSVRPCSFYAPFTNWVNYGLNGFNVTCPTTGHNQSCQTTAQCLAVSPLCVPGTVSALSCVSGTCQVVTMAMPTLQTSGGLCAADSNAPVCAKCTGKDCGSGVALCVANTDCSAKSYLECHENGHDYSDDL